ncbi:hypothetical protein ATCVCanal1_316R [Acanthocystis turfacea Chlorella virus Canal-1]|nr:hypothetical protein ATCVCanal1_316R [Acanthocystis turfacea Chlorella virus Canal-1]
MAVHNNIIEESPGPLSNRFKQLKAKLGRQAKEDPVMEDIQETPAEYTEDMTSPGVEEAPEEIHEEEPAEEVEEPEVLEEEPAEEVEEPEVLEEEPAEEVEEPEVLEEEPAEEVEEPEVLEEEPAEEVEEPEVLEEEPAEEPAEEVEVSDDDDIHETEVSDVEDNDASVDVQTSPDEVSYFEDIEASARDFSEMSKEKGMYAVKFTPIYVQTPVLVLEDYQRRSAILRLPQKFCDFVASVEKSVGEAAKENREKWFKAPLDDDDIAQGLKTFLSGDTLTVKVDEDFALFDHTETCVDDIKTPVKVRCILKTSEISFGKSEFGTIFTLKQAQLAKTPKCKISKPKRATEVSYFE